MNKILIFFLLSFLGSGLGAQVLEVQNKSGVTLENINIFLSSSDGDVLIAKINSLNPWENKSVAMDIPSDVVGDYGYLLSFGWNRKIYKSYFGYGPDN